MLGLTNEPFSGDVNMASSVFVLMLPVPVSHRNECLLGEIERLGQGHINWSYLVPDILADFGVLSIIISLTSYSW